MINIPIKEDGPDMDLVEKLVSEDASIKGMWCIPKYSNPTGTTYSDDVIHRLAALRPLAKDFRIFCDNAYAYHPIYEDVPMCNILEAFKNAGNANMLYLFSSTNKVTFPGAAVACFGGSKENVEFMMKQLSQQMIGYDKINTLRHIRYFKDLNGIKEHMKKHTDIIRPKFDIVIEGLTSELISRGVGDFTAPKGGYFITYYAPKGCAANIVALCKEMGVALTNAGAAYPYGKDEDDSCIRIAPTFATIDELKIAVEVFCVASRLVAIEKLL